MTYDEFMRLRAESRIACKVDRYAALQLINFLPRSRHVAHIVWSWVWLLSIPGSIAVALFVSWWLGLLLLFVLTPLIFRAVKRAAVRILLAHAERDPAFFDLLVRNDKLTFREG